MVRGERDDPGVSSPRLLPECYIHVHVRQSHTGVAAEIGPGHEALPVAVDGCAGVIADLAEGGTPGER